MRALVIGGTGFVGLNLVDELLAQGARVRVTRRKRSATILLQGRAVELVDASLDDTEKLASAMSGCDVAFLAGAYYPRYSLDLEASLAEGVRGVRAACEAARGSGVKRLIYTSTIATLATAPADRLADERDLGTAPPTGSIYRAVKWAMEREVDLARRRGLDVVTMMPGGCIGPWDVRLGTGSVIVGVVRGLLPWWVDGLVNLVDVGDVARAHVAAATRATSDRYCLPGHDVRVGWLLRHLAARYGGKAPTRELTADDARAQALADEREAAPHRRRVAVPRELVDMATSGQRVSGGRARAQLGIEPTPLDESLDRAHAWFLRHGYLPKSSGPTPTATPPTTQPRTDDTPTRLTHATRATSRSSCWPRFCETDADAIDGAQRLREDLGMDSLQSLELLSCVGESLKIDLDIEEAMGIRTVDDACAFVLRQYQEQRAHGRS